MTKLWQRSLLSMLLAVVLVQSGAASDAAGDGKAASAPGGVCYCNEEAPPSSFERAILTALRAQSDALATLTPETTQGVATLWQLADRLERVALRTVEARTAFYASLSCNSPASGIDAVRDLMAEALRQVKVVEGVVADQKSALARQSRKVLSSAVSSLERDLDVQEQAIQRVEQCGNFLDDPTCRGSCSKEGETCGVSGVLAMCRCAGKRCPLP